MVALSLVVMSVILFGCSSQLNGKMIKVSISKSSGFSNVNQDFSVVYENQSILNIFESVITKAFKQPGIVDMAKPDLDFEVVYSNGKKQGFHLWLGERGHKGTLMHVVDTHIIYTISEELTNQLIDLLDTATQSANIGKPHILNHLGLEIDDEIYAGSYVDEEGVFNINIVGAIDAFNNKTGKIKFHSVDYSLKYLDEVAKFLTENMLDLGISAIEPNEKDNKVYIYLKDLDENKRIRIKNVIDSPAIEAKEHRELRFN